MNIRDIKIYLGITKLKYNLDSPKIMQSTTAASADHGMPISFAKAGDKGTIVRISGDAGAVYILIRDHRSGKCSCGCECDCSCCGKCVEIEDEKE